MNENTLRAELEALATKVTPHVGDCQYPDDACNCRAMEIRVALAAEVDALLAAHPVEARDGEVERLAEVIKAARFSWATGSDGDFDRHLARCVLRDRAERVAGEGGQ